MATSKGRAQSWTAFSRIQFGAVGGDLQSKSTPEGFSHFGGPIEGLAITEVDTYGGGAGTNFLGFETHQAFLQEIGLHFDKIHPVIVTKETDEGNSVTTTLERFSMGAGINNVEGNNLKMDGWR